MKKLFLSVAFMALTTILVAQQGYEDVVYLKNGSILHGVIIEQVPNQSIKIQTADRNVFVYKMDEIERFTKESVQTKQNVLPKEKPIVEIPSGLEKGYQLIIEMGSGVAYSDYGKTLNNIDIVNGIRFNPNFSLGVGTGIRVCEVGADEFLALPIFLDLRLNLARSRVSPYLALGIGYSQSFEDYGSGGFVKPSAGISFRIGSKNSMNIGLCLDVQSMTYSYTNYSYYYYPTTTYSDELTTSLGLNVGFSF